MKILTYVYYALLRVKPTATRDLGLYDAIRRTSTHVLDSGIRTRDTSLRRRYNFARATIKLVVIMTLL
jgi:hypothetical protein